MHHLNPTWLDCIDLVWVWGRLLPYIIMTPQSLIILFDCHHKPNPLLRVQTLMFSTCGWPEMLCLCSYGSSERGQTGSLTIRCGAPSFLAFVARSGQHWGGHFICKKCKVEVTRNILKFGTTQEQVKLHSKNLSHLWCWSQKWQLLNTSIRYRGMSHSVRGCLMTKQRQTDNGCCTKLSVLCHHTHICTI